MARKKSYIILFSLMLNMVEEEISEKNEYREINKKKLKEFMYLFADVC